MEWKRMIKIGYWWLFHILIFAAAALLFWDACKVRLDADPDARIWKQEQAAHVGQYDVPFWLKLTDMFLYSIYILLFVTIVAIIASGIKKKIS